MACIWPRSLKARTSPFQGESAGFKSRRGHYGDCSSSGRAVDKYKNEAFGMYSLLDYQIKALYKYLYFKQKFNDFLKKTCYNECLGKSCLGWKRYLQEVQAYGTNVFVNSAKGNRKTD